MTILAAALSCWIFLFTPSRTWGIICGRAGLRARGPPNSRKPPPGAHAENSLTRVVPAGGEAALSPPRVCAASRARCQGSVPDPLGSVFKIAVCARLLTPSSAAVATSRAGHRSRESGRAVPHPRWDRGRPPWIRSKCQEHWCRPRR